MSLVVDREELLEDYAHTLNALLYPAVGSSLQVLVKDQAAAERRVKWFLSNGGSFN